MKQIGDRILYFEEIDSTNEEVKRQAEAGAEHGLLIVADAQTSGKGRRGRCWESPAGNNIFMSLLLRPSFGIEKASMITLVMALSVLQAIRVTTELEAFIKWPNDIVINGKKVVGILTELMTEPDGSFYLVCGVGINVNQREFPEEISATATSLLLEKMNEASEFDRKSLTNKVIDCFAKNYQVFCKKETIEEMLDEYNTFLVNRNASVRVLDPKGEYEGVALGINPEGELLVQCTDGDIRNVYAGEVSVRGIYGYV